MQPYAHLILGVVALAMPVAVRAADETGAALAGAEAPLSVERFEIVQGADARPPATFAIPDLKVSARGLAEADGQPLVPPDEQAVGAKLRPFKDLDLLIGTEMSRSPDAEAALHQEFNWQFSWSRRWDDWAGLKVDVSTTGAVDAQRTGLPERVGGSVGIPLFRDTAAWETQLRLSQSLTLDAATGTWKGAVTPELVTEKALSPTSAPMRSVLSVKLGSGVTPDAQPSASAKVEFRISPKS
jgi:hypothetical protein